VPASGSYLRVFELAKGGMGTVDLAVRREGSFQRLYAVKRLRESYRDDDDFRQMFLDEARIAGLLRHPNVVSVLDVGEDRDGPYLVMDYVEGASVGALLKRLGGEQPPLSVALRIVMEVAEGLHAAHELRDSSGAPLELVHRDVSPQNVLLGVDGHARVTDFGIAKALGRLTKTDTGILKGKLGYMAPEQLRFEEPDRRSDIFSLGVVLFELLTAERLYRNEDGMDGARKVLNEPPPDLAEYRDDAPPELVELCFALLAKDPTHRPQTALEVARRLEVILAEVELDGLRVEVGEYLRRHFGEEIATREAQIEEALLHREERPRRHLWVAAAALLLLGVGGVVAWQLATESTPVVDDVPRLETASAPPALDEPVAMESDTPEVAEVAEEPEEQEPPPSRMRRTRMRPRMSSSTESGGATPMWGWQ